MEELNAALNAEFFEAAKGEGEPIGFSDEQYAKCMEKYIRFNKEESRIESVIRKERIRAAAQPDVFLTF